MKAIISNKQLTLNKEPSGVAKALKSGFDTAVSHRKSSGIDARILNDLRQATSIYNPCTKRDFTDKKEPDVYFPLGAMKSRAQVSWMKDVVAGAKEKMWEAEPTPIPDLPVEATEAITEEVLSELSIAISNQQVFNYEDLVKIVNGLVDEQVDREYQNAVDKAKRMSRYILDQWVEGGWLETWDEIASDLSRCSIAIAKGPVDVLRRTVSWSTTGKLKETYEAQPIIYRVAPQNFYPMPDVTHEVNSGTGIYELTRMSIADLQMARDTTGYNKDIIDALIEKHPNGWEVADSSHAEIDNILNQNTSVTSSTEAGASLGSGVYHTIKYYGRLQVKLLREGRSFSDIPESLKDDDFVNVEAWLIEDQVIYLKLEPYPLGDRPFSVVPREFVAGSIWGGESLQSMIETPQRIINALVRQHVLNMGYAAGPVGEAEASRFSGAVPKYIEPRRIYQVNTGTHGEKALRFTDIPVNTQAYITAISFYLNQADSLSGIPGFIEGSPGVERNATLGHTQFYFGNASRGIDSLLGLIDRFLIETMLHRFYYRNLMKVDDNSLKGDVRWKARGLSGVFQKQGKRDQSIAAIQLLAQIREVMPDYVTQESFLELVRPVFENIGLDIDQVLVDNEQAGLDSQTSTSPEQAVNEVIQSLNITPSSEPTITSN